GSAGKQRPITELSIAFIMIQDVGCRITGNVNVRPTIIVKVRDERTESVDRGGLRNPTGGRKVRKSPVTVIVIENISSARQTLRTTVDWDTLPNAILVALGHRFLEREVDIVCHEKIQVPVFVIVKKRTSGVPASTLLKQAR